MKNKITSILTGSYIWIFLTFVKGIFIPGGESSSCIVGNIISIFFGFLAGFAAGYLVEERELLISSLAVFMGVLPLQLMFLSGFFDESGICIVGIIYMFIPVIGGFIGGLLAKLLKNKLKEYD